MLLSLGLCLWLLPSPAAARSGRAGLGPAQLLRKAARLYDAVEYAKAARLYRRVAGHAQSTPAQRVQALEKLAYCLVALGREAKASDAFLKLLRIQPRWRPPPHLSPKVKAVFAEARRLAKAFEVSLGVAYDARAGGIVVTTRDPEGVVERVEVRADPESAAAAEPARAMRVDSTHWRVPAPAGSRIEVAAVAYNAHGFPVAEAGRPEAPVVLEAPPPAPPASADGPPSPVPAPDAPPQMAAHSPWAYVLGAAGAGALAAGGVFGWRALQGARRYERDPGSFGSQAEALAWADAVERDARTANLLYATGGVLFTGGLVLWLTEGDEATGSGDRGPVVVAGPLPGGLSAWVAGTF